MATTIASGTPGVPIQPRPSGTPPGGPQALSGSAPSAAAPSLPGAVAADAVPKARFEPITLPGSVPTLPQVIEARLEGASVTDAARVAFAKANQNRSAPLSPEATIARGEALQQQRLDSRMAVVQQAQGNFFEKAWNGIVSFATKNPAAFWGGLLAAGSALATAVGTGGAALPAALPAIAAALAPIVSGTLSESGLGKDLNALLGSAVESALVSLGVDPTAAWKIGSVSASVILAGVNIGVAAFTGNVGALDPQAFANVARSIADAAELNLSDSATLTRTFGGIASLGITIGGFLAGGGSPGSYANLGDVAQTGTGLWQKLSAGFTSGTFDLAGLSADTQKLWPQIQSLFGSAMSDLEKTQPGLIADLQKSFGILFGRVDNQLALYDALPVR